MGVWAAATSDPCTPPRYRAQTRRQTISKIFRTTRIRNRPRKPTRSQSSIHQSPSTNLTPSQYPTPWRSSRQHGTLGSLHCIAAPPPAAVSQRKLTHPKSKSEKSPFREKITYLADGARRRNILVGPVHNVVFLGPVRVIAKPPPQRRRRQPEVPVQASVHAVLDRRQALILRRHAHLFSNISFLAVCTSPSPSTSLGDESQRGFGHSPPRTKRRVSIHREREHADPRRQFGLLAQRTLATMMSAHLGAESTAIAPRIGRRTTPRNIMTLSPQL